ncbi:MAG: CoA transferase [Betaproteobacteria bacterium]|nr:CoA transferase [Betaproteobacteria bacterium]
MSQPLANVRILDLSRILAGPWCSQILADLGAEVIKIERPGKGDDTRGWGPPFIRDASGRDAPDAAYFQCANRGKKSVTIDIAKPEGQALVRELAARCDVLLENFKVGDLARYGLGYDDIRAINPRIIYCSITGFGQTGPYRDRAGYDFMIQAMGGLMSVTGERDDLPGGGPQKVGVAIVDLMTGMYSTVAILGALWERNASGEGQHIDMALLDTQVGWLANQNLNYLISGEPPQRLGNAHPNVTPYDAFKTRDGDIIIAIGNDAQYARFCEAAGAAELIADARFKDNPSRVAHRTELKALLEPAMRGRTTVQWIELLEPLGVPCGPINRLDQVFADPQVVHRGLRIEMPHPLAGRLPLVANPIKYSRTPIQYQDPPPLLGQHTDEVLRNLLEKSEGELAALRNCGAI